VATEFKEIEAIPHLEAEAKQKTSYLHMLKTTGNKHRLFITITLGTATQRNGIGIVSYCLSPILKAAGITDATQQTPINDFLQVWNLIMAISACRLGRRFLFPCSCIGMLISYMLISSLSYSVAATRNTLQASRSYRCYSSTTAPTTSLSRS
jgi:Sugar (and other) transporter